MALRSHLSQETILELRQVGIATKKDPKISLLILDIVDIATNIIAILLADQLDEKLGARLQLSDILRSRCGFLGHFLILLAIGCSFHGRIDTGDETEVGLTNLTMSQTAISTLGQQPHGTVKVGLGSIPCNMSLALQPRQCLLSHGQVGSLNNRGGRGGRLQPNTKSCGSRLATRSMKILLRSISVCTDNRRSSFQGKLQRISRNGFTSQWFPSSGFQNSSRWSDESSASLGPTFHKWSIHNPEP